ncbi:discoidin domain-containing protein [Amycolatopsis sp. H20-H5]|uniref:discoidin domain-containing protein n=1 Tax=Amycolatopsis sp. H20-H5 TaxID=3046309 RepID=UPI002DB72E72|nr:discoidin domain-containing protein [Amycolatopsis sp. H20-H5]MEC3981863.1 discoidin domain-containing protein [Amycolatopsis sp. H20-H5]
MADASAADWGGLDTLKPGQAETDIAKLVAPVVGDPPSRSDDQARLDEMLPQAAQQRVAPVRKQGPTRKLNPGDLVCGECGEGNRPPRKFCHRCGTSLLQAEQVRASWWRRVFRRRTKVKKAGTRPKTRGAGSKIDLRAVFRKIRGVAAVAVILSGMLFGFYPPFRTYVLSQAQSIKEAVVNVLPSPESAVRPASVVAAAALPEHPAKAAFDLATNTYWAAPWATGTPPKLTVDLGKTVALRKLIITAGAGAAFTSNHRPARLLLTYSNERSESIAVPDSPKPQEIELKDGLGVRTLTVEVLEVHQGTDASAVAITEIEFFGVG